MYDLGPTTEQRPTLYNESSRRDTVQTLSAGRQHETPRLLGLTGLTTDSPNKPVQSTLFAPSPQRNSAVPQQLSTTNVVSKVIQPQSYNSSVHLNSHVQLVTQRAPVIQHVHIHEQPITVVPREDLEKIYYEKYLRMEQEMNRLLAENIKLRSVMASEKLTITEDTTRVNTLQFELERYMRIAKEQEIEIETWKKKYIDFEAQVQFQYGIEIDYMRVKNLLQETEITLRAEINAQKGLVQQWKDKYLDLEKKIYGINSESTHVQKTKESKIRELQGKIALMTTEIERMRVLTDEKNQDIARWKQRFTESENQQLEKDRLLSQMNVEVTRLKTVIDQLNGEIKILKTKVINPAEFQQKINILIQENDQLKSQIRQLQMENDNLKQENHVLSQKLNDTSKYKEFQDHIFKLEGELKKAQRALGDREAAIADLNKQIQALNIEIENSQQTETHVTYLNTEINTWKKRFETLNRDYHNTQEALMMAEAELESIKKRGFAVQEITQVQQKTRPMITVTKTESVYKHQN